MSKRIFAIELDVDDMESNIYMRMSQSELLQLHDNINHLLLLDDAAESHNYRQTVKDEYSGEKVSLTIGLHKWAEVSR
ncbi:hypothetical protein [Lacticaseibacillus manihotivorans]|nr:hypothetical protein [Lacticaseibacillus manihotivorans]